MKKIVCILLMSLMLLTFTLLSEPVYAESSTDASQEQYLASGTCGENLTWTLDDAGVLTISGTGAMEDYLGGFYGGDNEGTADQIWPLGSDYAVLLSMSRAAGSTLSRAPWDIYSKFIRHLVLPEGLTHMGSNAFYFCINLTQITFSGHAPTFGYQCFAGVRATAFYPGADASWTDEVRQSCSGAITWEPVYPQIVPPTLTPKYPTLSFESEIYYNIFFAVENDEDVQEIGMLTYDAQPQEDNIWSSCTQSSDVLYDDESGLYSIRSRGISAKNLGDELWFRLYARLTDGSYAYSAVISYSARSYANNILQNSKDTQLKTLCVAMLNYGAAAQQHFGYKTDDLMNADLTEAQQAMPGGYYDGLLAERLSVDTNKAGSFRYDQSGYVNRYPSVSFDGTFTINYIFQTACTPDGDVTLYVWNQKTYSEQEILTGENATQKLTMIHQGEGVYQVSYTGIAAKDMDQTVFVAGVYESGGEGYCTGVLPYSIGTYCENVISNGTAAQRTLAETAAVYGSCARDYFAN